MADAILSVAAERLIALIEQEVRFHFNLVRGAEGEVRSLARKLNTIKDVLDDAENRRFQSKSINSWLSRLEQTSYEMGDVLDEWNYALLKLQKGEHRPDDDAGAPSKKVFSFIPSSPCLCFKKNVVRHHIAKKILNVKAQLDEIYVEKDQHKFVISPPTVDLVPEPRRDQTSSFIFVGDVRGRGREGDILVSKLMTNMGSQEESGIPVVSIVGVGGLGKTTLAQLVYNHSQVEKSFDLRIWVCVSDPFDLVAISKGILESIKEGSSRDADQLDVLFKRVRESISGNKFLLVLDDVWTEEYKKWEPLKDLLRCGGTGSKILVTTRSERVAVTMGTKDSEIFHPGLLSDEDCWLLLCRMALSERDVVEFENVGKKIAQKCRGLPLAAKTLGGLLRFRKTFREWENVLTSEIWEIQEAGNEIFRPLFMSYKELSPTQKRCFSYCAIFPKDYAIDVNNLIENWMALGYLGSSSGDMELNGGECFDVLAMRSLFQDFMKVDLDKIKECMMHDIVHDLAQFLRKSGKMKVVETNKTTCGVCDPLLVSSVNEFFSLYCKKKYLPNFCGCLVRLRVLSLAYCDLQSVPHGMNILIHLRWLDLQYNKFSTEDLKIIFHFYYLQTLNLRHCGIEEIPEEIENLSDLRHLNLSDNKLKELPSEIGNLIQLRHFNLSGNEFIKELPSEIGKLTLLQTFILPYWENRCQIPQELAQLTGLRTLDGFEGSDWNKLRLLKNLNQLSVVRLSFRLEEVGLSGVVENIREAELNNKSHIEHLDLRFQNLFIGDVESISVIDALEPHPNLKILHISGYEGSKLPQWIISHLKQLRIVHLDNNCNLTSLPSLGKLPCLEEISVGETAYSLEVVGREFLGIPTNMSTNFVAFPKLKTLIFDGCYGWEEWEDITAEEEEESAGFQVMPCLTKLKIRYCISLKALPHRLLRKASSLETLELYTCSSLLERRYENKDGSDWKSISLNNPRLKLVTR